MRKRKKQTLSLYERGELSRKKIPYNKWFQFRDVLFERDLNTIFQEFVLLDKIDYFERYFSLKTFYRITLKTGEKIDFIFSFLKRESSELFIEKVDSQKLVIIINGDLVGYAVIFKKIKKEINKRLKGYETESCALKVINNYLVQKKSDKSLIVGARKATEREDRGFHSDIIVEWSNGKSFGIDIKTDEKYFKIALEKRGYEFSQHGNPVLTSIKQLNKKPELFIERIEFIGKKIFESKKVSL